MDRSNLAMYSEAHMSYDSTNRFLSFNTDSGLRRLAAEEALREGPHRILDIATGTGDMAINMAKLVKEQRLGTDIIALDANEDMLRVARAKSRKERTTMIDFVVGDALELDYPAGYFDSVTCSFSIKNFGYLNRFAREAHRVLKNNGRLVILDMSIPNGALRRFVFRIYLNYMNFVGFIAGKKLYRWLPKSTREFNRRSLIDVLDKSSFSDIKVREFHFGMTYILVCSKKEAES